MPKAALGAQQRNGKWICTWGAFAQVRMQRTSIGCEGLRVEAVRVNDQEYEVPVARRCQGTDNIWTIVGIRTISKSVKDLTVVGRVVHLVPLFCRGLPARTKLGTSCGEPRSVTDWCQPANLRHPVSYFHAQDADIREPL